MITIVAGVVGVIDGLRLVILCTLFCNIGFFFLDTVLGSHKTLFLAHRCTLSVIYIELEFLSFYSLTVLSLPLA